MKNLKVTAMILAATLSAGTLMACSSNKEADNTVSTVESETVASEESIMVESESTESSELMEDQEKDAMAAAVLQYIKVARVEKAAEDGTLELTLFELPETSEEVVEDAAEVTGTEVVTEDVTETTETNTAELSESVTSEETSAFDFASLDLSIFVETEQIESYQPEETTMVQLAEDGVLAEAVLSDIQTGDMLVLFMNENEVPHIVIYRNIAQEETAAQ